MFQKLLCNKKEENGLRWEHNMGIREQQLFSENINFDETWVHHNTPETKQQ